jgi:hypothetical protein
MVKFELQTRTAFNGSDHPVTGVTCSSLDSQLRKAGPPQNWENPGNSEVHQRNHKASPFDELELPGPGQGYSHGPAVTSTSHGIIT